MDASIVIRTYNEGRYLADVLRAVATQNRDGLQIETVVVDSGSTDRTLEIAGSHGCRIVHIPKEDFSFGRSLNVGCDAARGRFLIFVSGHCVPVDKSWLQNLLSPLGEQRVEYTYGRQIGDGDSKFSECQLFRKFFPETSAIPQDGFFCNNANAALRRDVWVNFPFNEELTGLEDMELGKRLIQSGMRLGYVASAPVYHRHDESWRQVRNRYEREAVALQGIMPEVHLNFADFIRYFASGILLDMGAAVGDRRLIRTLPEIVLFRLMQFWGSYRGNHEHRKLSKERKERYFYPK